MAERDVMDHHDAMDIHDRGADQSMRGFIATLMDRGELVTIDRPIDPVFEMGAALALLDGGPAVAFSRPIGYQHRVVANLLGTRDRVAAALSTRTEDVVPVLRSAFIERQEPVRVAHAPCQERVLPADAAWQELPTPTFFEQDSGSYVTAGVIVAHDPVTGHRNASFARIRPESSTSAFIGIAPNHHLAQMARSARDAGTSLPIAVTLGTHPAIQMAACFYLKLGDDELEHAASLLGEPIRVVEATTSGVLVPADAEIVLEGTINIDAPIHEGLTSEYHGMYEDYGEGFTVQVDAVTTRRDPIGQVVLPGLAAEHAQLASMPIAAGLVEAIERIGVRVSDLCLSLAGGGRVDAVVSLTARHVRHARRVIMACFSALTLLKQVTVVDADVDVWNAEHVQWARTTFTRWDKDLMVLRDMPTDRNVPMQVDGFVAKVGMDATAKPGTRRIGTTRATPPVDVVRRVHDWLREDGLESRVLPTPVIWSILSDMEEENS